LTMALLGAWALARMLGESRPQWRSLLIAASALVMVLLSEARTAGFAMLLGLTISALVAPGLAGLRITRVLPGLLSRRVYLAAGLALATGLLAGSVISERMERYIAKKSSGSSLVSVYDDSRGELIRRMWSNVERSPWTGIGFGLASDYRDMEIERDATFGLPVGAPVEKGVMPIAVLEELGIVGFVMVGGWLSLATYRAARGGVIPLAVMGTVLFLNFGEATFFSPGGVGMLPLVLFGWGVSSRFGVANA